MLLEGVGSMVEAERMIASIRRAMAEPIILSGQDVGVGVSVGAAVYPDDGVTQTDLHAVADQRMYANKEQGRSQRLSSQVESLPVDLAGTPVAS